MKIPVIISNGFPSIVNAEDLDELLQKNELLAFHRMDGWVKVGFDEIRDIHCRRGSSWKDRKKLRGNKSLKQISKNHEQQNIGLIEEEH